MQSPCWILRYFALVLLFSPALLAKAQESIEEVLDRGYPAEWLVCGPFEPDAPGGIRASAAGRIPPLGEKDYMAPVGGMAQLRPRHLLKIPTDGGEAIWQRAGTSGPAMDLAPFFPGAREGVAFAAVYLQADRERQVLARFQSVFGVRVYFNGLLVQDIHPQPLPFAGTDDVLLTLGRGINLLVVQVPGARIDALADTLEIPSATLRSTILQSRPMLENQSGFAFGFYLAPAQPLGHLVYTPKLQPTGSHSGFQNSPSLDTTLTVFNPGAIPAGPVEITATPAGGRPVSAQIQSVVPNSVADAWLPIPQGNTPSGETFSVQVSITSGVNSDTFTTTVTAAKLPPSGTVHVLNGALVANMNDSRRSRATLAAFDEELLSVAEGGPGFFVPDTPLWRAALAQSPERFAAFSSGVSDARIGFSAAYAPIDERLVGAETLLRNLAYGVSHTRETFPTASHAYVVSNTRGIAPQTIQVLNELALSGIVTRGFPREAPFLFRHMAPDGTSVLHRNLGNNPILPTENGLRAHVLAQRHESLHLGLNHDLAVVERSAPRLAAHADQLRRQIPAIELSGTAANRFFDAANSAAKRIGSKIPTVGQAFTTSYPGEVLAQPQIKQAYAAAERTVLAAETTATFAALLGAPFPDEIIDSAWRGLFRLGQTDTLGFIATPQRYVDTLDDLRAVLANSQHILDASTTYLAGNVNTQTRVPESAHRALVVFNPSSSLRTDVVDVALTRNRPGLRFLDASGAPVPFAVLSQRATPERTAHIRFVANDVPAFGLKTFYLAPADALPRSTTSSEPQIANDLFSVTVDPQRGGAIVRVQGTDTEANLAEGLWNDIVAWSEDPARTNRGRDLWTTGIAERASDQSTTIQKDAWPHMERLTITTPFLGGRIIRELTIYEDIPRIDCRTQFEGINSEDVMVAATFESSAIGRAPIFGERFGALVGQFTQTGEYRTANGALTSGVGLQPAHQWVAVSRDDTITNGAGESVPFLPTTVIPGADPLLRDNAARVVDALVRRGIPATMGSSAGNAAMHMLIGGPDANPETQRLLDQAPQEAETSFLESDTNAVMFLYDDTTPTLILAGSTPSRTSATVDRFTDSLAERGQFDVPAKRFLAEAPAASSETSLAILYSGARLAGVNATGEITLGLFHATALEQSNSTVTSPKSEPLAFEYSLYPFQRNWRDANVVKHAQALAASFIAIPTDLHIGSLPNETSFLDVTPDSFTVTSVTPGTDARDTLFVRGYESTGAITTVDMTFFAGLLGASRAAPLGQSHGSLTIEGNRARLRVPGFKIQTVAIRPSQLPRGRGSTSYANDTQLPVYTRHWKHNASVGPAGLEDVSLVLEGDLSATPPASRVKIANLFGDQPVTGRVVLETSPRVHVTPVFIDFDLAPTDSLIRELAVSTGLSEGTPLGLAAMTKVNGRWRRDVMLAHGSEPTMEIAQSGSQITVTVRNRNPISLKGALSIISSPNHWPEFGAMTGFGPHQHAVHVPAFEQEQYVFEFDGQAANTLPWFVVKFAGDGYALYASK